MLLSKGREEGEVRTMSCRAQYCKMVDADERKGQLPIMAPLYQRITVIPLLFSLLFCVSAAGALVYALLRLRSPSSPASNWIDSRSPFFVFGDSYADVGNIPFGSGRSFPYGITWPGYPAGRFSNGHVQSDYLATQVLGLPSPSAFQESNLTSLKQGANFAVGGAGVTFAYGSPPVNKQVDWFESVVKSGVYTTDVLASSVTLLCISGNDYGSYRGSVEDYPSFVVHVVGLMEQSLRRLHGLGLWNIMVTTVAPINCLGASTYFTNFTACRPNATVDDLVSSHNTLLEMTIANLLNDLPGMNIILLKQDTAMRYVQNNLALFNMSDAYKPCCVGNCGRVGPQGNKLFSLCADPETHVLWDDVHPTQATWKSITDLYLNDQAFTKFSPSLQHWYQKLS